MASNVLIKNAPPGGTFATTGNSGVYFPYESRQLPEQYNLLCPLVLEENREIVILSQEGDILYTDCL